MLVVVLQVILLLTTMMVLDVDAQDCQENWFGEKCMYMCHCSNVPACTYLGVCFGDGVCKAGYFGPGCQYVDLASKVFSIATKSYLRDHDETTCNPDKNATSVDFFLQTPSPFSWIRIHVDDKKFLNNFTITLNDLVPCSNERRFQTSSTSVDITCDIFILLSIIVLKGAAAAHVCSIYISGGRNVALKQHAVQTTTRTVQPELSRAYLAVDGNTNGNYYNGSCSHTGHENKPEWTLEYNRPQSLLRIIIYNRDAYQYRLQGFTLETFGVDGQRTNYFLDNSSQPKDTYDIILTSRLPVSSIKISASTHLSIDQRIVTLCEVKTFGDTICPEGKYGLFCSLLCFCSTNEICNDLTGACAPGCPIGFYGYNCSTTCRETCDDGTCLQRLGVCYVCVPGYTGRFCDKACARGTYGLYCKFNCSIHCDDTCSHQTGKCNCKDGYSGFYCTECPDGFYGPNCSETCRPTCEDHRCDIDTGQCLSCHGNRIGFHCEGCPDGYYGNLCFSECSRYCWNQTCDINNGTCDNCTDGYTGPHCRLATIEKKISWLYMLLIIPSALYICACYCIYMKQRGGVVDAVVSSAVTEASEETGQ